MHFEQTRRFLELLPLALVALFIVGLTDFLTHPPFAIELTESF